MTSPDVSPYVDLTLLDVDAQDLVVKALAIAETAFPDWVPLEGHVEVVLIEALAQVIEELVFAVNRLPASVLEVLLRLYGLTRDPGLFPIVSVDFTVGDDAGNTIPAGTVLRLDPENGLDPVLFTTDVDLLIPAGSTVGTVAATGTSRTADVNGTPPGTVLTVVSAVAAVEGATTSADPVLGVVRGGVGPETGYDFLVRARLRLQQISTTLVSAAQFEAAAAEYVGVLRVSAIDNWNADTDAAETHHITIAVLGEGAVALSVAEKNQITSDLTARAIAGMAVHVVDIDVVNVTVDVTVVRQPGYDDAVVAQSVADSLATYLNPDLWPFAAKVYLNEIIAVVDAAPGVLRVVGQPTLNGVADDLTLTGLVALPLSVAPVVTVQAP